MLRLDPNFKMEGYTKIAFLLEADNERYFNALRKAGLK